MASFFLEDLVERYNALVAGCSAFKRNSTSLFSVIKCCFYNLVFNNLDK